MNRFRNRIHHYPTTCAQISGLGHKLGLPFGSFVLPDQALSVDIDEQKIKEVAKELDVDIQERKKLGRWILIRQLSCYINPGLYIFE
jgi:hypothetical protein